MPSLDEACAQAPLTPTHSTARNSTEHPALAPRARVGDLCTTRPPWTDSSGCYPSAVRPGGDAHRRVWLEQLVLAAEDLADRVVHEYAPDRIGPQVRVRQHADVARAAGSGRHRVGHNDLLQAR